MMMLQRMIVKNGLIRINDQYPSSPRQTSRIVNNTRSSLDAPSFEDRSSSFIAEPLIEFKVTFRNVHSITSSASARIVGGVSRLSDLVVLRLMTKSNFVGCWAGNSAGFAPFKILSTKYAERR